MHMHVHVWCVCVHTCVSIVCNVWRACVVCVHVCACVHVHTCAYMQFVYALYTCVHVCGAMCSVYVCISHRVRQVLELTLHKPFI